MSPVSIATVDNASKHWKRACESVNDISSKHVKDMESHVRSVTVYFFMFFLGLYFLNNWVCRKVLHTVVSMTCDNKGFYLLMSHYRVLDQY